MSFPVGPDAVELHLFDPCAVCHASRYGWAHFGRRKKKLVLPGRCVNEAACRQTLDVLITPEADLLAVAETLAPA